MAEIRPPTVSLAGSRTRLRPFRLGDAANIAESCADSAIPRYTLMPEDMTEADARQWIQRRSELWSHGLCSFAITLHPDDVCVGQMGVHIEIEQRRAETFYWLDSRIRGRGLAAEALDTITKWVFDSHGVLRAHLITHLDNAASQRVAARGGYQREGVLRAWEPIKDSQPDVVMWSRLATDPPPDLSRT